MARYLADGSEENHGALCPYIRHQMHLLWFRVGTNRKHYIKFNYSVCLFSALYANQNSSYIFQSLRPILVLLCSNSFTSYYNVSYVRSEMLLSGESKIGHDSLFLHALRLVITPPQACGVRRDLILIPDAATQSNMASKYGDLSSVGYSLFWFNSSNKSLLERNTQELNAIIKIGRPPLYTCIHMSSRKASQITARLVLN